MVFVPEYKEKKVAVFGLGRTGISAAGSLLDSGAEVYAWDDNEDLVSRGKERIPNAHFAPPEGYDWNNIQSLILSPGVPLTHPTPHPIVKVAKEHECEIICDIELLSRASPESRFIGITGTNGKSTTTALIGHIIKEVGIKSEVGGNLGTSAAAFEELGSDGVYVIECSSYQLDLLNKTKFDIAALLNITPDHIDRHGDMNGYISSKLKIFDRQSERDFAIISIDDEYTQEVYNSLSSSSKATVIPVSTFQELENGFLIKDGIIFNQGERFEVGEVKRLPGLHNAQNIVVAFAVLRILGVAAEDIISGVHSFPGLSHRMEFVADINGVQYINDSKATNAVAAEKALSSFDNIYWIAGGVAKDGGITSLEPLFSRIKKTFLIGQSQDDFSKTLEGKVENVKCDTLEKALAEASIAAANDTNSVVLLSPACASFDQFKSFEERGELFSSLVKNVEKRAE